MTMDVLLQRNDRGDTETSESYCEPCPAMGLCVSM